MAKGLRRFRYTRKKGRGKALLLLAAALFTGGTALSEWGLGSISEELTQEAARAYVLAQVNQAVEEALAQPRPFVTIERDGEGEPVAVQADTAALNELRLQVLGTLEESLNGSVTVEVPVGSRALDAGNGRLGGPFLPNRVRLRRHQPELPPRHHGGEGPGLFPVPPV